MGSNETRDIGLQRARVQTYAGIVVMNVLKTILYNPKRTLGFRNTYLQVKIFHGFGFFIL